MTEEAVDVDRFSAGRSPEDRMIQVCARIGVRGMHRIEWTGVG